MTRIELIRDLEQLSRSAHSDVRVVRLSPSDFPLISGYLSESMNPEPHTFRFTVAPDQLVVGVRLIGTSILQQDRSSISYLVLPGKIVVYPPGDYSTMFGRGACTSVFLTCNQSLLPLNALKSIFRTEAVPVALINLESDHLFEGLTTLLSTDNPRSYFKFAAVLMGLVDRVSTNQSDDTSNVETTFKQLCSEVLENPERRWTTAVAAAFCGYSVHHFSRTFRLKEGIGFADFVRHTRATIAMEYMFDKQMPIDDSLRMAGIYTISEANKLFRTELGLTLSEIKRSLKSQVTTEKLSRL